MAEDMFLDIKDVTGESKDSVYSEKMEISSWGWGLMQPGSFHSGGGGGTGKVQAQDLHVTMYLDRSSPTLMDFICKHKHPETATLTCRKRGGGDKAIDYLIIEMNKVLVSSVMVSAGGDRPVAQISLNFAKAKVMYKTQNDDGSEGPGPEFEYDFSKND